MGPTWVLSVPDGPHVDPMDHAIRVAVQYCSMLHRIQQQQTDEVSETITHIGCFFCKYFDSLAPEKWWSYLTSVFVKLILRIDILITSCEIGLMRVPLNPTDYKSIGLYNDLVPSGNNPLSEPKLLQVYDVIWRR